MGCLIPIFFWLILNGSSSYGKVEIGSSFSTSYLWKCQESLQSITFFLNHLLGIYLNRYIQLLETKPIKIRKVGYDTNPMKGKLFL